MDFGSRDGDRLPVDDLHGKVDLPIVLLEALTLGTPALVLDEGPLSGTHGGRVRCPVSRKPGWSFWEPW